MGYDRRKYADEPDFDDRSMENNKFSDVMKEEARSARIGKEEDAQELRREQDDERRKKEKRKQREKEERRGRR
jgi:protein SPT2